MASWSRDLKFEFGIHEFLYTYFFKEHEREKGRFIVVNRPNRARIITDLKMNDRGCKDKYFLVESLALNDDGISTCWCIPGECVYLYTYCWKANVFTFSFLCR